MIRTKTTPMKPNPRKLLQDYQYTQTLPPPPSPTTAPPAPAVQLSSSSMAVTSFILISALFFLGFFTVCARWFFTEDHTASNTSHRLLRPQPQHYSYHRSSYMPSSSSYGLDPSTVRALPRVLYASGGAKEEAAGCVVCLSEFEEKECVKLIPGCGHLFHPQCIDVWLASHGSCPLCRSTQIFGFGVGGSDGEEGEGCGEEEEEVGLRVVVEREEEVERGEGEEGKVVGLVRSSSCCWKGGEKRRVILRRTCSV